MPMKPGKDEEQSDFMGRCVPDLMGDNKRPKDQAVAACLQIWRDEKEGGGGPPKKMLTKQDAPEPEDDEDRDDYIDRCTAELLDEDEDRDEDEVYEVCASAYEDSKSAHAKPRVPVQPVFHKTHTGTVQGYEFILSDETIDRMGDVISSDGWDITSFKNNPVALFNHSPMHPIGKWVNLRVENGALKGHLQLAPKGTSPRIDEIRALVDAGILQAVSVGFKPIESKPRKSIGPSGVFTGGEVFVRQELIECSLVSVPANPNALAVAKSLNVSPETVDLVFRQARQTEDKTKRREFSAKHGETSREGKGGAMSLAQRIADLQTYIGNKAAELDAHIANQDDTNVKDSDVEKTNELNAVLAQLRKQHAALVETEKNVAGTVKNGDGTNANGRGALTVLHDQRNDQQRITSPYIIKNSKKDWEPLDYLVHAGVCVAFAKANGIMPDQARLKIYGEDEATKVVLEWTQRAAAAPAMTTVTGWATELVQQIYADLLSLLMAKSVFPRFAAKGMTLSFGRAGKIVMPSRSRTPSVAGSFVGEGMAIPVRQGAFVTQTFIPKKLAVITTFTREMSEHSIPAIEGVLRDAIQEDTAVAIDSVLLDANPATTIRPAGLLNGVSVTTATAGGGVTAIIGDIKSLVNALTVATYGNIRSPVWLMNPSDMLSASMAMTPNTGIFPFKDEIGRGTLNNIPIIDSATVVAKTIILADAADFVVMGGEGVLWMVSDQATLHMEDTAPADLVGGSPAVTASPQRSLFQTDSLGLRMICPLNWGFRRSGMVAWSQNVTW